MLADSCATPNPDPCANVSITASLILTAVVAAPNPMLTIPLVPASIAKLPEDGPLIVVAVVVVICAVVLVIAEVVTFEFITSPTILLLIPSNNIVLSSPNTLPFMSVLNTCPSSNNPASVVFKSALLKYPTSFVNSESCVG
ncbi:MAG: Uncharacterised protein [Porticoccaceae bacterium UBA1117]|nr:MAG: Uncharacterised protein [Porticoccaceae bacterium UBA1117]